VSIDLANDLWVDLKNYIDRVDREDAASIMVELLSDYDHSIDEIIAAFSSDPDVKEVLQKAHPELNLDDGDSYDDDDEYFHDDE